MPVIGSSAHPHNKEKPLPCTVLVQRRGIFSLQAAF